MSVKPTNKNLRNLMSSMSFKNVWAKALAKLFKKKFMDFVCFSNLRARFCVFFFVFFLTFFLFFCMRYYNLRDTSIVLYFVKELLLSLMKTQSKFLHFCEERKALRSLAKMKYKANTKTK